MISEWHDKIFSVTKRGFQDMALEIFHFQYQQNTVYSSFIQALRVNPSAVDSLEKIPFLPISFFKTREVVSGNFIPEKIFESSGTTSMEKSRHFITDTNLYKKSFLESFENNYGPVSDYCIIGLLPSYMERDTSSLIFMVNELIRLSHHSQSGFYLDEFEKLKDVLLDLEEKNQKTILIGVTFALLDFAEKFPMPLQSTIIMETGGMKGRRQEMTRNEVHNILKNAFSKTEIHSEYGMTELLSQAYSNGNGKFNCPPWMKILVRNEEDPLDIQYLVRSSESGVQSQAAGTQLSTHDSQLTTVSGAINIIDLANIYSCSFIATDDVGKLYKDGSFEIFGRLDGSDLRGCSLMVL